MTITLPREQQEWLEAQVAAGILDRLSALAGIAVAERYASDLQAVYERLEMFPSIGAHRPILGRDIRIVVLEPFVVFYRYLAEEEAVTVVRVLDGRRNITRGLLRS
jgi:toxin ParE1/3/4